MSICTINGEVISYCLQDENVDTHTFDQPSTNGSEGQLGSASTSQRNNVKVRLRGDWSGTGPNSGPLNAENGENMEWYQYP